MFRDIEKISSKERTEDDRRFVRAALEAMKGNDEGEKVNAWKNAAAARLRERYGIDDLNNIVSFYPFYCGVCGKVIEKGSNRQTMCKQCYVERKNY